MTNDQDNQGGFPQKETGGQSTHSTTGDGHPPRPGEAGYEEGGTAAGGNAGQQETGGTGGYGGTSGGSGGGGASGQGGQ